MRRRQERGKWKRGKEEKGWKEFKKKKKRSVIGRKEKRKYRDRGERQKEEKEKQMRKLGKKKEGEKMGGERRRRKKNRESSARDPPPSPDAFPSTKLGNNMTPIKGRLGKNTTPTCKRTAALNHQKDPQQRRQGFCDSSYPVSVAHQRKRSIQSISPTTVKPLFIRKSKPSETSANVPNSSLISSKVVRAFSRKSEV